ncbi:MAG TPA: RtcB family protein, partial [Puia sp.]|nr:RtcB family protein [Puia sp.]
MAKLRLKGKDLRSAGYPEGPVISIAMQVMEKKYKFEKEEVVMNLLRSILASPMEYENDAVLGLIAQQLLPRKAVPGTQIMLNDEGVHFNVFGNEHIEQGAIDQMRYAARLPIALAGALMPDAHAGYGLPIGGVLATENA